MSNTSFTRAVVQGIVKNTKIGTTGSKGQERSVGHVARELLTTKFVQQCLVLNQEALSDLVWAYNQSVDTTIKTSTIPKYKRELVAFVNAKSKKPNLKTSAGKQFSKLVKSAKLTWNKDIFYLPETFKGVREVIQEFNEDFSERNSREFDQSKFGKNLNYDHGGEGVPSGLMGAAIGSESVRQNARGTNKRNFDERFKANLKTIMKKGLNSVADKGSLRKTMLSLQMTSHQLVNGQQGLVAGMSMLLTPKRKKDNLEQAPGETEIQDAYIAAYQKTLSPTDVVNMDGSSTILEKVEQLMVDSTFGTLGKRRNIKQKRKSKVANKTKSTGKADEPEGKGVKVRKLAGARLVRGAKKRAPGESEGVSPFSYMAMINKRLPQTVRKNMGAPGLVNRTGAFASSVKLQDVNTTPQGHPSFGYTYDKNPYQVFEVGTGSAPWSNSQRDPRKLIDRSIREVAAELALGRFYTRRL